MMNSTKILDFFHVQGFKHCGANCYVDSLLVALFSHVGSPFHLFNCEKHSNGGMQAACENIKKAFCKFITNQHDTIGIPLHSLVPPNNCTNVNWNEQNDPGQLFLCFIDAFYREPYKFNGKLHNELVTLEDVFRTFTYSNENAKDVKIGEQIERVGLNIVDARTYRPVYNSDIQDYQYLFDADAILRTVNPRVGDVETTLAERATESNPAFRQVKTFARPRKLKPRYDFVMFQVTKQREDLGIPIKIPLLLDIDDSTYYCGSVVLYQGHETNESYSGHYRCLLHDYDQNRLPQDQYYLYDDMSNEHPIRSAPNTITSLQFEELAGQWGTLLCYFKL